MIGMLINAISPLLEKVVPDVNERAKLAHDLATMTERHAQEIAKGQMEINKAQASHPSMFVAGARPAAMWVCVAVLANNYILLPYAGGLGMPIQPLDSGEIMPLLLGMLGLTGARSYEKAKGVARHGLKKSAPED